MNSCYHRQEDWNKQSAPRADKATTCFPTRIDEDHYKAHTRRNDAAPADRRRRPQQDTCATPATRTFFHSRQNAIGEDGFDALLNEVNDEAPLFLHSRQNAIGEDGFNALLNEINDEELLPMQVYLPNLY
jgi:hypothetical protein